MKATISLSIDTSSDPFMSTNDTLRWLYDVMDQACEGTQPPIEVDDISVSRED